MRMLPQTQTTGHELYNIGHMLQGVTYYRATGDRKLLDAGIRFVTIFYCPITVLLRRNRSCRDIRRSRWA
jgi:hypothetical protein